MNHSTHLAAFAVVVAVAGCAGTPFKWEDTQKVQPGMTEAEVVAILGNPYSRSMVNGNVTVLTWSFASAFGSARAASYRFVNGRVAASTTMGQQ